MRDDGRKHRGIAPQPDPYTPEGQIRLFGLLLAGLRHPSRRRRKAMRFLGWWLLASTVLLTVGVLIM